MAQPIYRKGHVVEVTIGFDAGSRGSVDYVHGDTLHVEMFETGTILIIPAGKVRRIF